MARPSKKDSEKRQLIGARFDPDARKAIVDYADKAGVSAGAEVEKRVAATLDFDEEGLALIAEIGAEIREIHAGLNNNRWHQTLKSWAAVMDMFRTGPLMARNPDPYQDDEAFKKAFKKYSDLATKRKVFVEAVADHGFTWSEEPTLKNGPKHKGLFGSLPIFASPRQNERNAIDAIEPGQEKENLIKLHDELCGYDRQIEESQKEWLDEASIFNEQEQAGRDWNRERQRQRAVKAYHKGQDFDIHPLLGSDPWGLKTAKVGSGVGE